MNLVWIFLAIALGGLVMVVCYGVWLWHKASDLASEVRMVGKRGEEMIELLDQIKFPELDQAAARRSEMEVSRP